ncbi:GTPase [Microbacterium sp. QXD-8]|uniref:GTPase n=1 Tax=Microbacterium psychrotolerans TaxID=3068321 RepID=A0ABU0Z8S3_9MICO|nr:GTPase [Microbacterium sp. QXD-8]MDQ7880335.1 GTPase [Microbacterium sp. QXD-8]
MRDAILAPLTEATHRVAEARRQLLGRDVDRPFRIVLMGRTMAGKSTLFEFLTGGDGASVGRGGQRTTRESHIGAVLGHDIEIVDTPGVGAMDGDADYEEAFSQVADADLILWVATNEATQERTGRALEQLGDYGKPILVALNCLRDVTDQLDLLELLEDPDFVFGGDTLGNLKPIDRHLARAGGRYISAVLIHAQAALMSQSSDLTSNDASDIRRASMVERLLAEIGVQRDRTADTRRAASIGDFIRGELLEAASATATSARIARAMLTASRGSLDDFKRRADRRVDDAHNELLSAFSVALSRRERWIERIDVGLSDKKINAAWASEMAVLKEEISADVDHAGRRLERHLKRIALDVADDWAHFDVGEFQELGGRGAIWGNRLVKVGGRFGAAIGTTILGAKIGAVAGTALGPGLGNAIGLGLGAIVGLLTGLLGLSRGIDWVSDKVFQSAAEVRERRRVKIRDQLSPLLVQVSERLTQSGEVVRAAWQQAVDQEAARHAVWIDMLERAERTFNHTIALELEPILSQVDTEIARELLRIMGRGRAASALIRATRWRGAGMAVELPEPEFSELVLFPIAEDTERVLPTAASATSSASAIQLVRNLTDGVLTAHGWKDHEVRVELTHPLAPGAQEAWQSLARTHAGVSLNIIQYIEGDAS